MAEKSTISIQTKERGHLRISEWWNYKIPPLLGMAFSMLFFHQIAFQKAAIFLLLLLIWAFGAAGFGYFLNDWTDIKEDQQAGKSNGAARLPLWQRWLLLLVLLLLSIVPWFFFPFSLVTLGAVGFQLLLFVLYSVPPVRLKPRYSLGILADALYAHVLPGLIALSAFNALSPTPLPLLHPIIGVYFCWSLAQGARNIILHQIKDRDLDTQAGLTTLATLGQSKRLLRFIRIWILPVEIIAFTTFIILVFNWFAMGVLSLLIIAFFLTPLQSKHQHPYVPVMVMRLNWVYEAWFPPLVLLLLCFQQAFYFIALAGYSLMFWMMVKSLFHSISSYLSKRYHHNIKPFYYHSIKPFYYKRISINLKGFYYRYLDLNALYWWIRKKVLSPIKGFFVAVYQKIKALL